jgi:hypothetical protein
MRSIKIVSELANGATPVHVHMVLLTRAEVLELAEREVLMANGPAEPLVVWLTDDMDGDTEMLHDRFADIFASKGVTLEVWNLGEDD